MGKIPGRRSHGHCLTLLIMNDDVTRTMNGGGGGGCNPKSRKKTALNLKFAVAFDICYDQYEQYDNSV